MINLDFYLNSKLMIRPKFGERYQDVVIKNTFCTEHPIHMHDCVEILYVFRGTAECKISFEQYLLHEGDFLVINAFDLHRIRAVTDETAISCIHVSQEVFPPSEGFIVWWIDILKSNREIFIQQTENLRTLIRQYAQFAPKTTIRNCIERILQLFRMEFKLENYQISGEHSALENSQVDMERIGAIYMYLYRRCNEKLTLEKLASEFAISKYYLSHFIKKVTGNGFQKSLRIIRCERAEIALLSGNETIEEIREQFALSSSQSFNEGFKMVFGMIPNAYRKKYQRETILYRDFQESPIFDISAVMKGRVEITSGDKIVELHVKEGAERMVIVESVDGSEVVTRHDLTEKSKIRIELQSDETIIVIKKQESLYAEQKKD